MPLLTNQSIKDPLPKDDLPSDRLDPLAPDPSAEGLFNSPERIVSLVPSLTELLYDLCLEEEVVGITKFCVHPDHWFRTKKRIGGTKNINVEAVRALQPDLVIANKEENLREEVEELARHYPVWVTDIRTRGDALEMIRLLGRVTGRSAKADSIAQTIEEEFIALGKDIKKSSKGDADHSLQYGKPAPGPVTAYFIWRDPYMVAGGDTFIHEMMKSCGLQNAFADRNRYPVVTIKELKAAGCDCVLLSSEPYPFKEKHIEELQKQLPGAKILLADGQIFSWYGSRMLKAPEYFKALRERIVY